MQCYPLNNQLPCFEGPLASTSLSPPLYQRPQYIPPPPPQNYTLPPYLSRPEVVGEGDIITLVHPDGSIQYYFVPSALPHLSTYVGPFRHNVPPWYSAATGLWLVKSLSNPIPSSLFYTQYQRNDFIRNKPFFNDFKPGYHVKFHADGCTSTTDLHYFYPSLRGSSWLPKVSAALQVDLPIEARNIHHYQVVCNQPCHCLSGGHDAHKKQSCMSIDDDTTQPKNNDVTCKCTDKNRNKTHKCDRGNEPSTSKEGVRDCEKTQSKRKRRKHQRKRKAKSKEKKEQYIQTDESGSETKTSKSKLNRPVTDMNKRTKEEQKGDQGKCLFPFCKCKSKSQTKEPSQSSETELRKSSEDKAKTRTKKARTKTSRESLAEAAAMSGSIVSTCSSYSDVSSLSLEECVCCDH